jgi:hypothetical protein
MPWPTLKSSRLTANWPSATLLPAASFFSVTGTATSLAMPFIDSVPAIS